MLGICRFQRWIGGSDAPTSRGSDDPRPVAGLVMVAIPSSNLYLYILVLLCANNVGAVGIPLGLFQMFTSSFALMLNCPRIDGLRINVIEQCF